MTSLIITTNLTLNDFRYLFPSSFIEVISNKKKNYMYKLYYFDIIECKTAYKFFYDFITDNPHFNLNVYIEKRKRVKWYDILSKLSNILYFKYTYNLINDTLSENKIYHCILTVYLLNDKHLIYECFEKNIERCKGISSKMAVKELYKLN